MTGPVDHARLREHLYMALVTCDALDATQTTITTKDLRAVVAALDECDRLREALTDARDYFRELHDGEIREAMASDNSHGISAKTTTGFSYAADKCEEALAAAGRGE